MNQKNQNMETPWAEATIKNSWNNQQKQKEI